MKKFILIILAIIIYSGHKLDARKDRCCKQQKMYTYNRCQPATYPWYGPSLYYTYGYNPYWYWDSPYGLYYWNYPGCYAPPVIGFNFNIGI